MSFSEIADRLRDVILREMRGGSTSDPSLAEILGVRLLLVNVLRPLAAGQRIAPEAFDKLLDQISDAKHQLAAKLATAPAGKSVMADFTGDRTWAGEDAGAVDSRCRRSSSPGSHRGPGLGIGTQSYPPRNGSLAQPVRLSRPQPLARCLRQP